MPGASATVGPNLGLYYGLDPLMVPARALQDGRNFRVDNGRLTNVNLGWQAKSSVDFETPMLFKEQFRRHNGTTKIIVGTTRDLYSYDEEQDIAAYLNPTYSVGTVTVTELFNYGILLAIPLAKAGTLVSSASGSPTFLTEGIKAGDMIHFGAADYRDPAGEWFEIASVLSETTFTLTTAPLGAVVGQPYTIRKTYTGDLQNPWCFATFVKPDDGTGDDLFIACNGIEPIVSWDGDADVVTEHQDLGFVCVAMAVYKNMLIYGGVIDIATGLTKPLSIINSDIGKPLAAGALGTGLSEEFRVHDGTYPIRALRALGDNLAIYTERQIILAQFVGDPLVFAFREVGAGIGPISNRAIADFGDYHEFIGQDTQYLFDGVTTSPVNEHVWREVLRQRDASRQEMIFHTFDEERGDLIWAVPLTSDAGLGNMDAGPEEAFVEHYLEEVGQQTPTPFSRRSFPFTCGADGTVSTSLTWEDLTQAWEDLAIRWNDSFLFAAFPTLQAGSSSGTLYELNTTQTGAGAFQPSYVLTGRRPTIDGVERGLLTRVYAFASQTNATLDTTVRISDFAAGPNTIQDTQTMDTALLEGQFFTAHFRAGRYFELMFGNNGEAWQISGYDVEVRNGGRR